MENTPAPPGVEELMSAVVYLGEKYEKGNKRKRGTLKENEERGKIGGKIEVTRAKETLKEQK